MIKPIITLKNMNNNEYKLSNNILAKELEELANELANSRKFNSNAIMILHEAAKRIRSMAN